MTFHTLTLPSVLLHLLRFKRTRYYSSLSTTDFDLLIVPCCVRWMYLYVGRGCISFYNSTFSHFVNFYQNPPPYPDSLLPTFFLFYFFSTFRKILFRTEEFVTFI